MQSALLMPIALLLAMFAAYRVARDVVRLHRADRRRHNRLRELARDQSGVNAQQPARIAYQLDEEVQHAVREDFGATGVALATLGVASVFLGRSMGYGQWAVGLYTAGLCCILAGVALALLGGVLRVIGRPLAERPHEDRT